MRALLFHCSERLLLVGSRFLHARLLREFLSVDFFCLPLCSVCAVLPAFSFFFFFLLRCSGFTVVSLPSFYASSCFLSCSSFCFARSCFFCFLVDLLSISLPDRLCYLRICVHASPPDAAYQTPSTAPATMGPGGGANIHTPSCPSRKPDNHTSCSYTLVTLCSASDNTQRG